MVSRELKSGDVGIADAENNRLWLEESLLAVMPKGNYIFDRAPRLQAGMQIYGNGSTIANGFEVGSHPANATMYGYGLGCGWHDRASPSGFSAVLENPQAAGNYRVGRVAYAFKFADRPDGNAVCQRRTIRSVKDATVTFNEILDSRVNALNWLERATPVFESVSRGDWHVFVLDPTSFITGQLVFLTSGESVANELRGEFLRIASVDGRRINFTRGASRDYSQPALALLGAVEFVTIKNLTFAASPNPDGDALFLKFGTRMQFANCTFNGHVAINGSTSVEFLNCKFLGQVTVNTSTRIWFNGCQSHGAGIYTEEADSDIWIDDYICLNSREHGIRTGFDPQNLSVRNAVIVNPAARPFAVGGPDNHIERVVIRGGKFDQQAMFGGDRLTMDDVSSDGPVVAYAGNGHLLRNVRSPALTFGWVNGGPSNGRAIGCTSQYTYQQTAQGWLVRP